MRIAVDARNIYREERRGIGRSLTELYRHLARRNPDWEFVMLHRSGTTEDPLVGLPNVRRQDCDCRGDRFDLWQHVQLPWSARRSGADVLHAPANTAPWWPGLPLVVTIHDLIPLDPEFAGPGSRAWARNVARAARTARMITTPSEYTKTRLVREFSVPAEKVVVNPWAPDPRCRRVTDPAELSRVRDRYGMTADRPYVLVFGSPEPRKNTRRLLHAWKDLPERVREAFALLVMGLPERARSAFGREVKDLAVDSSCILRGFADEADLPALLSGAALFVYPSLSEGFGLPLLDAFACETPVLCGRGTSLSEVAGDAAFFVDPRDVAAMAHGLADVLDDERTRAQMVSRGLARVRGFTWAACAARMEHVLAGFGATGDRT